MKAITTAKRLEAALVAEANSDDAMFLQRFFKTGEGQYGAGDLFIGVRVPVTRKVCGLAELPIKEVEELLASPVHECRLAAVILLANRYKKANEEERELVYRMYVAAVDKGQINNWDIVDTSAEFIIGEYLWTRSRDSLFKMAKSEDVWHRRVAVLSSFGFIKKGDPSTTLQLAELLLHDNHDLIQKAVGWMLREIGKRIDRGLLIDFLEKHAKEMPRTMLRYAIEHLDQQQRARFMLR
jgi:3-methyladenine DNA glycosylase AlkD